MTLPTPYKYIQDYYKVPACQNRLVVVAGRPGIIVEDMGSYIGVNFFDTKATLVMPVHPTDQVEYGEIGKPQKTTASQRRYREFLQLDLGCTFSEFLNYKK